MLIDDDVVKTYILPDVDLSSSAATENIEAMWKYIEGRNVFHLVVPNSSSLITVDATTYLHPEFEKLKKAEALVIKTLGHRMLAQVYIKVRSYPYPIKIFNNEEEAMKWFESLRLNQEKSSITSAS